MKSILRPGSCLWKNTKKAEIKAIKEDANHSEQLELKSQIGISKEIHRLLTYVLGPRLTSVGRG